MNPYHQRLWPLACGVALLSPTKPALAQSGPPPEEPRWLKLRLSQISTGIYAEGDHDESKIKGSGDSSTYERLFVGPSLGMTLDGSIYHPNLVKLHVNTDGAYGWSNDNHEEEYEYLGRFNGVADIFSEKPLNASVFGDYDHSYRDYDFFSRTMVDTWRYGGRLAYTQGPWHFLSTYTHRKEDNQSRAFTFVDSAGNTVRDDGLTTSKDDTVTADLRHERDAGGTTANYTFNQYSRQDFGSTGDGRDHTVSLADSQNFGNHNQHSLLVSASYFKRDNNFEPSNEYMAHGNLDLEHRSNLDSIYDFTFDRYELDNYRSDNYNGFANLRHRLYESLTSTLILQGANNEVSEVGGEGYTRRIGGGFSESYSKQLGLNHRLHLGNTLIAEHVETLGASSIANEAHTFGANAPPNSFFLDQPYVKQSTIQVFSVGRTQQFVENLHYRVLREGASTRIERLNAVPPMDNSVIVDYEVATISDGSYDTLNESFTARLDLWNNTWGIYGRVSSYTSNAREDMRVEDVFNYAVGTDLAWRMLRAGAEYDYYDSTFTSYKSMRLNQGVTFDIDQTQVFSLDFNEVWTSYMDSGRDEDYYSLISRYRNRLTASLSASVEGGISLRRGEGVEQDLAVVRPSLDFVMGKSSLHLQYEFEHELYLQTEERNRHRFIFRWRRLF